MDVEEFRIRGKEMVDYICEYLSTLDSRYVTSSVEPGYIRKLIPSEAPEEPETWDAIMEDVRNKIMQGITHWQHRRFHAYFPSGNSFPSILGDMLSDAIGCIGFSWAASPACTELETVVLDWFGKAIGLPDHFMNTSTTTSTGGGVIQPSASDCILVTMLAARNQAIEYLRKSTPGLVDSAFLPHLVAYCSEEAHSCVEKAAKILLVTLKILNTDNNGSLHPETLLRAIEEDESKGLTPFFLSTTLGTTSRCSFDNLKELGPLCKSRPCIWLHVDAAYAGNAFICPELRYLLDGIEYADSFNTNPNKWLLVNFDCSCLWVKSRIKLTSALVVDPIYLQYPKSEDAVDYRHWGIPLSRRFRSLKLWFVMRKYGIKGLREYIRNHIKLAKRFEALVCADKRFEVMNDVKLGLVCFRLRRPGYVNRMLLTALNTSRNIYVIPTTIKGKYVIRFCVVREQTKPEDIDTGWTIISDVATRILESMSVNHSAVMRPPLLKSVSRMLSFTRSVSIDVYKRSLSRTSLYDGATPLLVPEQEHFQNNDDILAEIHKCSLEETKKAIKQETI